MKLFMFYIGGDCDNSNIELHDVRFSAGDTAEACHDDLRGQWWGNPKSLHLDCWGAVEQADGYDVMLIPPRSENGSEKLFFLNLGGYDPEHFEELHQNVLLVAPDSKSAVARSLQQVRHWSSPHRDKIFEVERSIDISAQMHDRGLALVLTPAVAIKPFHFVCKYLRLA